MRVALTGTPGTGKSTVAAHVETTLEVIDLNQLVRERDLIAGHDDDRDTAIVDFEAVRTALDGRDDILIESHLAHHLPADRVIVLRCRPDSLRGRLLDRGESASTVTENAESEILDLILSEAVERHGLATVYEIDTTDRSVESVANDVEAVIEGRREPAAGIVSFEDHI